MAYLKGGRCYLPDLFKAIAETKAPERSKRVDILKEYVAKGQDHERTLRGFIECMYHPAVKFALPEGKPPYKENTAPDLDHAAFSLFNFFHQKYVLYFADASATMIKDTVKRELLYIRTLESLHKSEANILLAMKEKDDKPFKNFTESLCREAFPDYLPPKA